MNEKEACKLYELRQYDTPLLIFRAKKDEFGEIVYSIEWVNEDKHELLPIGLKVTPAGIGKWLRGRILPKNRQYAEQILSRSGFSSSWVISISQ